jgi:hypothetical protein
MIYYSYNDSILDLLLDLLVDTYLEQKKKDNEGEEANDEYSLS